MVHTSGVGRGLHTDELYSFVVIDLLKILFTRYLAELYPRCASLCGVARSVGAGNRIPPAPSQQAASLKLEDDKRKEAKAKRERAKAKKEKAIAEAAQEEAERQRAALAARAASRASVGVAGRPAAGASALSPWSSVCLEPRKSNRSD